MKKKISLHQHLFIETVQVGDAWHTVHTSVVYRRGLCGRSVT